MNMTVSMEPTDLTLNDGQRIRIAELHQYRTYEGMLCGLPNETSNRYEIEFAMQRAEKLMHGLKPLLIAPRFLSLPEWIQSRYGRHVDATAEDIAKHPCLPAVMCIANFKELTHFQYLALVWFQDDFAPPIAAQVQAQIKQISWSSHSVEQLP